MGDERWMGWDGWVMVLQGLLQGRREVICFRGLIGLVMSGVNRRKIDQNFVVVNIVARGEAWVLRKSFLILSPGISQESRVHNW